MKRILILISILIFSLVGCVKPVQEIPQETTDETIHKTDSETGLAEEFTSDLHSFSFALFSENLKKDNPVLSPVSAFTALALAGSGANKDTLTAFHRVLGNAMEQDTSGFMSELPRNEEFLKLSIGNSIWIDERMNLNPSWQNTVEQDYLAEVFPTSLSTEKAMADINNWVNTETEGLIPSLLNKPMNEDARLALINTVYFKGKWQRTFDQTDTRKAPFYKEDGSSKETDMMGMYNEYLLYVKNDISEGIILPYRNDDFVFLALLPSEDKTVREMYHELSKEDVYDFCQTETTTLCNLTLPKFEVTFEEKLNDSLISMGLGNAFDPQKADFSKMGATDSKNPLYISNVLQKSVVIVDEEGTEASAATIAIALEGCALMEEEPVELHFNRPFVYMILEKQSQTPLFMGIMDCP